MYDNGTSPTEEPAGAQAGCGNKPPRRILVVDDDASSRRSSAYVLLHHGYRVDATEDGTAGWEALNENSYDLLITGNNPPKVSGVELLKKLRAARMALPVIMVTESRAKQESNKHPWLKPVATLPKPFTGDELLGTVKKLLGRAGSAGEQLKPVPGWRSSVGRWFKALSLSIPDRRSD